MKFSVRQEPRFAFEFSGMEATSLLKALHVAQQVLESNNLEDAHERAALALCKTVIPALKKRGVQDTHDEIESTYGSKVEVVPPKPKAPVKVEEGAKPKTPTKAPEDSIDQLIDSMAGSEG